MAEPADARCLALLRAALDLPPAERAGWIGRECAGDAALRERLLHLLELDAGGDALLDAPLEVVAGHVLTTPDDESADASRAGERVGPWRLVRKLGEGGMGAVWLAERADGGFAQRVALKLIKFGMDSAAVQVQFRRERAVLAHLQHPHIAHLIDGGVDARGQPWFAMERVEGIGLREWLQRNPPLRARLELFLKLCRAVAYAHTRLVVHRDLKPANVMVQVDGEPRLLDFGIAKLLETDVGEETATTHRFLTRAYAAPEQLRGEPVSTATDVFALGVLLFEVLTGASYSDWRKPDARITRPSTVVRRARMACAQPAALLRGDLDAIVLRALAEEPGRRYSGAQALAEDVQRYLDGRAIQARPDGIAYRFGKLVRRNRLASAAIAAAVLALVGATAVSMRHAQHARRMAERAERSKQFLVGLLADANPFGTRAAGAVSPEQMLDNALTRIERDFADEPDLQIELRGSIALTLQRVGDLDRAIDLTRRNLDAVRALHGATSPRMGVALASLGTIQRQANDPATRVTFDEAERLLRDAGPAYARDRISVRTGLAVMANAVGDYAEARRLSEAVLRERLALEGPESPDIAMDLMNLAANALYAERFAEAEAMGQRARDMLVALLGPEHARLIYVDNTLGLVQAHAGHTEAGVATLSRVVERVRVTFKPRAPMYGSALSALGTARLLAGDLPGAIDALQEGSAILTAAHDPRVARTLLRLGQAQLAAGKPEALTTLRECVAGMDDPRAGGGGYRAWAQAALGLALARSGEATAGEALARGARADLLAGPHAGSVKLGEIDLLLADLLASRGAAAEAVGLRAEALEVFRRIYGEAHPRTAALATLGNRG